ncbi:hypothetical protein BGZ97_004742, partial [Linnemannia gamsii]
MSEQDIQQSAPVFTHHGLLDMIQDPNANRDEVLMHLRQLINDANQLNQQNATLQAEKFKGSEGDMTFMVFKAQLQAQINKLPHAFLTDVDRITYAFQCMSGAPAQYFAMLYNGQLPDTQGIM